MPKQVDHRERRRRIAEALWRITAGRGLEAVSLRDVATEAGVSMGSVQHYFTTKEQMLLFALEYMSERIDRRVRERVAASPDPQAARTVLRATLVELLPMDEEHRAEAGVWVAFLARAAVEPNLAAILRESYAQLHEMVAWLIRRTQEGSGALEDLDSEREAAALLALVDGLTVHTLIGHHAPESALAAVDDHLDRLFSDNDLG